MMYDSEELKPLFNLDAEQSVLGSIMIDAECWDRLEGKVSESDFYRHDHRLIFGAIQSLVVSDTPPDVIAVGEWLDRHKELDNCGGYSYLALLSQQTPSSANAMAYAKIVRAYSTRRQIVTRSSLLIDQVNGSNDIDDLVNSAQSAFSDMTTDGGKIGPKVVRELLPEFIESLEERFNSDGTILGIPTGWKDLDEVTGGLQNADLIIVAGRPSMGKAQPLDAKIKTLSGWVNMGDLSVGDNIASIDGKESTITGVFPQGKKQTFEIVMSDGRKTRACADHLWSVSYRDWPCPRVMTTSQLEEKLTRKRYKGRLWIDVPDGSFGEDVDLPLSPWLLGALIANGCMLDRTPKFSTADSETVLKLASEAGEGFKVSNAGPYDFRISYPGYNHNPITDALRMLGLHGKKSEFKYIPEIYLNASRESRVNLMQGLVDCDGWVEKSGTMRYSTSSEQLAIDVQSLVRSLGGVCDIATKWPKYSYNGEKKTGLLHYVCKIKGANKWELVSLPRKKERLSQNGESRLTFRSITPVGLNESQCISVSHESKLYITDDYIVTHNTTFAMNLVEQCALKNDQRAMVFSLEMPAQKIINRCYASVGGVSFNKIKNGKLEDDDWPRITATTARLSEAPLVIDDSSGLTVYELCSRARRVHKDSPLSLVMVDYIQLMTGKGENRNQEISDISRNLKGLAKELNVPVIALSQLSRNVENRPDKRPKMSDLRDSGAIEQDADIIIFPYRDEVYDKESTAKGTAEIIIAKHRDGECTSIRLVFQGQYVRFKDFTGKMPVQERSSDYGSGFK